MKTLGLVFLALVTLVSFAPVLGLLVAGGIGTWFDCPLDEGSVHACLVAGTDLGHLLYTLEVLGWLMFVTAPGMLVSLLVWLALLVRWIWRRRAGPRDAAALTRPPPGP